MKKVFYASILLRLLALILTGCHQPPSETSSYSNEDFKRQEEALISWGYLIKQRSEAMPTEWERNNFNMQNKKIISVKSQNPVPGEANTYYRFTLTEESYLNEVDAKYRLENLFQKQPPFAEMDEYRFALRKAYKRNNFVYVIGTDAVMFEKEMQRLAKQLEEILNNN